MKKSLWIFTLLFSSLGFAEDAPKFSLESGSFLDAGALPVLYTCDGKNVPPQILFKNVPKGTKYLALIMTDEKDLTNSKRHWIVLNMPGTITETKEADVSIPKGAQLLKNSFDKTDYVGPCPARGTAHEYFFTAFAYQEPIKQDNVDEALKRLKEKGKEAQMSAVYSRWFW